MKKEKGSLHKFKENFAQKNLKIFSTLRGELFLEVCICVFLHFYIKEAEWEGILQFVLFFNCKIFILLVT